MSRSPRAWLEDCRPTGIARGAGERAGLEHRVRVGSRAGSLISCLLPSLCAVLLLGTALLAGSASSAQAKSRTTHTEQSSAHPAASTVLLALGSGYYTPHGAAPVRVLQRRLRTAGFSPGPIDGRYGPLTQAAVEGFQASRALQVDGIAGPLTLSALRATYHSLYPGAGYTSGGSPRVRAMQRRLAKAGFSPGPIDGLYGPLTAHAVNRFQTAHGLPANGIADPATLTTLQHRPAPPRSPHPPAKHRSPQRPVPRHPTPAPKPAAHRTSSPPLGLIAALIALALMLTLATAWLTKRHRHERRTVIAPAINGNPPNGHADATAAQIHPTSTPTPEQTTTPQEPTSITPRLIEDTPGERAFSYALLLEKHGDEQGAIAAYERADRLGHPAAATNLGILLERHGERAAAEAAYRRAEQRGDPDGAFNLALLLGERGDHAGALHAYQRADQLGHPAGATNLGVLLEHQGQHAAAEAAYRRAEQRGDPDGAFNLALLLGERGDDAGALHAYQRADQLGHPAGATNLGVVLEHQGQHAAAEAAYQRAEQRGDPHGAFNLAVLLEAHGDREGAKHAYERAEALGHPEIAQMARAAEAQLNQHQRPTQTGGSHDAR